MDGEHEALSETGTNCNLASASETQSDNIQAKLESLEKKAVHLRLVLEKDFKAADLKWSLFVAAALSFRHESCLRPFPPAFMKGGIKDMDELLSVITDVPALDLVLQHLDNLENLPNIGDIIDLLFYVLVRLKEPMLKTVPIEAHESILALSQSTQPAQKPQCIFQVVSSFKSNAETKWKELSKNHQVFYAYHGNRLENFYTILNFGLQQHLTKNTLLGNGVYLSPELSVSLPYSHGGFGWGSSCIGGHLSCIAMCEVIDAPDGINYHKPVSNEGDGLYEEEKNKLVPGTDAESPLAQYIVTNCDLVRVRYMMVYAKQPASMRFPTSSVNRNAGGVRRWFSRHKLLSILLGYGLMLATIGFANNQPMHYYYKILLKKLDIAYNTAKTKVYTEKSLVPVEIYYGIPYATPPIGRFRFSAPERHTGWRRTLQAHRIPPHCPFGDSQGDTNYSEDCLFLNIWTPRQSDGTPLPVVVILYSESWIRGGLSLPCQDLAAGGVVVVTVGYRLHLLGFLNLGSISARGNLALLDQYLAFLWVRENIVAFDGDPNMMTVLGHSAGADSVLHHLTSPRANGMFQRAIIMSPRDIWKLIDEQVVEASAVERTCREIALSLGCNSKEGQEILHCMRTRPLSDILSVYSNNNWSRLMQPVPEIYLTESEQYLPASLLTALSNKKQSTMQVDLLLGTSDLEALDYNDETFEELMKRNASYVTEYVNSKSIPDLLRMYHLQPSELLIRAIRWEYWNEKPRRADDLNETVELVARIETSAKWGAAGALLAARLARRVSRLYVYRYSQPASIDLQGRHHNFSGATHGSDLIALLGDAFMLQVARRPATINEKRISGIFRRYIINFIKYGSPENENKWQRYKAGDAHIYEIPDKDSDHGKDVSKEVKFWLQYLPELSSFKMSENTQQLTLGKVDGRLRGGVFAMCGVAVVLLLLLCASAFVLQRQRSRRRFSISDDIQNT